MISCDKPHEQAGKEITKRLDAARVVSRRAWHKFTKARLLKQAVETGMVPLYRNVMDTAVERHELHRKGLFKLQLIANAAEKLLDPERRILLRSEQT